MLERVVEATRDRAAPEAEATGLGTWAKEAAAAWEGGEERRVAWAAERRVAAGREAADSAHFLVLVVDVLFYALFAGPSELADLYEEFDESMRRIQDWNVIIKLDDGFANLTTISICNECIHGDEIRVLVNKRPFLRRRASARPHASSSSRSTQFVKKSFRPPNWTPSGKTQTFSSSKWARAGKKKKTL